jgi:predicted DNA-binding antitoxin AbrB/MazE fold protein
MIQPVERLGTITQNGQLNLEKPLKFPQGSRVKVVISLTEFDSPETLLEQMANDPEIQQEIQQINTEFTPTEFDGLLTP